MIDKTTATPIQGVTIVVESLTDSAKYVMSSNAKGVFNRANIKAGRYTIGSAFIGYKAEMRQITFAGKPVHVLFRLEPSEIALEEVDITAPQMVSLREDTMEFDAKNFSTREFADADELIAQVPGVMIDEDGNVSAHGEQVTKIVVDGKEFFSSDPRIALKSLPAEIISKIQIIDEKSEQARFSGFDDGTRNKVINIVTKPERRHGYFGKANAGVGAAEKFGLNANVNQFAGDKKLAINTMANNINETNFAEQGRGGVRRGNSNTDRGLSDTYAAAVNFTNTYLDKNLELSADYNYRSLSTATTSLSNIEYISTKKVNQFRDQNQFSDILQSDHKLNARLRWKIDADNRLDIAPNIRYRANDREIITDFITLKEVDTLNSSDRSSHSNTSNFNFGGSLTYMHRFKKQGRTISLSMSGNASNNEAESLNLAVTSYYKNEVISRRDTNNNQSLTDGYGSGLRSRLAFTETLSRASRLQANYSLRNTVSYSNRETYEFLAETGQLGELRDRLSNAFRNDYIYHGGGLAYIYNKKDKIRVQAGINYEQGVRKNDRTVPYPIYTKADFDSFLPSLTLVYHFSKAKNLEINYHTETRTPTIGQLQDFINNANELNITNGNPNLNQEYAHLVKFQYRDVNKKTGRSLHTNIQFDYFNNKIINSILRPDKDTVLFPETETTPKITLREGGRFIAPENQDGAYTFRARNSYGLPIKKWKLNLNFNTNVFYNNNYVILNEELLKDLSYGFSQSFGFNSNIKKKYVIGLSYHINANYYENMAARVTKYNVYVHRVTNNTTIELPKRFVVSSNFSYFFDTGFEESKPIKMALWSASIGYKLFRKQNAELAIRGFDLLNNAQNVRRSVNNDAVTDIVSNTLTRYFILSFSYNLRQFGGAQNRKGK
ncbi:outer membrane beta-barrel protein [Sphingobacterium sp. SGG-5]|uniref:outer membrane beta-barrel protein n=1 Tax=Sphingobacterium sp. SGG-5 TaxID=2710881 RepID=UPI00293C04B7|nr:outer membrane beta-barrel protein [Sphingobacterium sp. SGG-5]